MKAKPYEAIGADLGEGPQLFPDGTLRWVDILRGHVFRKDNAQSTLEHSYPYEVSKVLPWTEGEIALTREGIEAVTTESERRLLVRLPAGHASGRCSDGTVLPDGSIAMGIVDRDLRAGRGSLVTLETDCQMREVMSSCTIPNGIATLASQEDVVWTDSATNTLTLFTWNPAKGLHSAREWVQLPESLGTPDGLLADSSGGVWVAMWGGGRVIHVSSEGVIDATIEVGTPYPTAIAYDAHDNLVITTAAIMFREQSTPVPPGAGDLWWVEAPIHETSGLPPVIARLSPTSKDADKKPENPPTELDNSYSAEREEEP